MTEPWLSIIGLGEDGPEGLTDASRAALARAEVVFGGSRHLDLVGAGPRGRAWPIPFDLGPLLEMRGRNVAMLVSGDPFWFGAGGSVAAHIDPGEWQAFPVAGTFSLVAARLGWRLENVSCLGLHAAGFGQLRQTLHRGAQVIVTLRDAAAVSELSEWLSKHGFAATRMIICEALGGPRERLRNQTVTENVPSDIRAPVAVALDGCDLPLDAGLPRGFGLSDDLFQSDGQMTKRPVRALTLSALAPRQNALLWDIGGGSGSVSVEWCLAGGKAICVEPREDRAENIRANAAAFGLENRLELRIGRAPEVFGDLPRPDAVFIGGGGSEEVHQALWSIIPEGTRLVANGVTLETEALLAERHARCGGSLLRIELAESAPLGGMRGWSSARPVVQWSVTR